jgi:malate dehydrogenase (oxaloacetate-decarboxylating)(NADP+)
MIKINVTADEALAYHLEPSPGKYQMNASKPLRTPRDLSLAYSPGVAHPVRAIAECPSAAYDYTVKGNMVAVISNGSAILGLGNLGALASKPVMEGKAALFKLFADINAIDIELDSGDVDELVKAIHMMQPTFGGINLEDIKAPECFLIEAQLKKIMDIPVFHDDQHGTAVIVAAGLINALMLVDKKIENAKIVLNGAGAAGIACLKLLHAIGARPGNTILCDSQGIVWAGRENNMNSWKSDLAVDTPARTLAEALVNADVFIGVSVKGALTDQMLRSMAKDPIIFALANPDPEITPEEALESRSDAIVATGRSDYPNQVNNVLCFPFIFRGALDARAREINNEMKIACAFALAALARKAVPESVKLLHSKDLSFGRDYIIPSPFDPRLLSELAPAVVRAALETGASRIALDFRQYKNTLELRIPGTWNSSTV